MSKAGILVLAAQFFPRIAQIRRGTWLAMAAALMTLFILFAWAAFALFGWLWGQGKSLTEGTPEAVRFITEQIEQAVPGAREKLGELIPALKAEPLPRDVSGADIGPVTRYPGLVRSQWQRNGNEVTVRYEGRADYNAVLDHYTKGFSAQGYAQQVISASPETETHEYSKGDERLRIEIAALSQAKVKTTITAVSP